MSHIDDNSQYAVQQAPTRSSAQPEEASLTTTDFVLVGVCFFLLVACVWVLFWQIIPKIGNGPHLSAPLFFSLLIYLLCVAAGWLWGRYQSQTVAHKENLRLNEQLMGLKTNVERLESERYSLQAQLRNAQAAVPARTSL